MSGGVTLDWKSFMYDRNVCNEPTSAMLTDAFFCDQYDKAIQLLEIGKKFIADEGAIAHRSIPRGKEELGIQSRYLHRGAYCPSPVLDLLITNAKRGKILVRPNARSKITNRYVFDLSGKLAFIDNYIDEKMVSSEYLIYKMNTVYGITIGMSGRMMCVSEEEYLGERILRYTRAFYSDGKESMYCYQIDSEKYDYDDTGLANWDYMQIYFSNEDVCPKALMKHNRYYFTKADGFLKSFTQTHHNGIPIANGVENKVDIKRKA